ncbi:MAG TPA: ROK family transcriptional regulator [Candidatus Ruania gallistercoris]|uniref:ROK family transcriptional regulator n=1 Tax=Candidatus Ruania gallistercoris TaxID=2838746 RepID=A0A9D2J414_9MICO|nr:ROK family transcriptional regulator [Candidatus Ruania gallistercoris]
MGQASPQVSSPGRVTAERVPVRVSRAGEVLQLVRSGAASTTSEIATTMSVARSTVSERIALLLRNDLLIPDGEIAPGRGRPSVRYAFNPEAGLVLTVQLGMSGSRVAITDLSARVLASRTVDVDLNLGPQHVFDTVLATLDEHLSGIDADRTHLRGVGLGIPSSTELAAIEPTGAGDGQPWASFDVAGYVQGLLGVPVYVDQDVNLLALAEHRSSWPSAKVFLCVKAGTSIGCGIVIDGQVFRGGTELAGQIAHTPVPGSTAQCDCGNLGCLNATASGAALVAKLQATHDFSGSSAREVSQRASAGDVAAIQAIRQAGRDLGHVLAGVVNLLNPEVLAVWGYLDDAGDYLLAGVRESIYSSALSASGAALTMTHATLGSDAGIQGAATAVIEQFLEPAALDGWIYQAESRAP